MSKTLDYIALIIVFIGALNWGLIGLFRLDLVRMLFGDMSWISRLVYGGTVSHNVVGERGFFQRLLERFTSIV